MDTENRTFIWVSSHRPSTSGELILDGIVFDGSFGFGSEDAKGFAGKVLLVSAADAVELSTNVSTIHIAREGVKWTLKATHLPDVPFLLTSDLTMKHRYRGPVRWEPSSEGREAIERARDGSQFPVVSADFLGVLSFKTGNVWLDAFSNSRDALLTAPSEITFCEWDTAAGTIARG